MAEVDTVISLESVLLAAPSRRCHGWLRPGVVEFGNGRVQLLTTAGIYARSYPLPANFPGDVFLSAGGRMALPTQGFREDSLVLVYDANGDATGRAGEPVVPPHEM